MPALELDDTEDEDSNSMPELESETDSSEPEDLVVHVAFQSHTFDSLHGGMVLWLHIAHACSPLVGTTVVDH